MGTEAVGGAAVGVSDYWVPGAHCGRAVHNHWNAVQEGDERHVNHCDLCAQDKDEAMLLVPCGGQGRTVCGTCARSVAQSLATCGALERSYDNRNDPVPAALRQILDQPP